MNGWKMPQKKKSTKKKKSGIKKKKQGGLLASIIRIILLIAVIVGLFYLINFIIKSSPKKEDSNITTPAPQQKEKRVEKQKTEPTKPELDKPKVELSEDEKVLALIKKLSKAISVDNEKIWFKKTDNEVKYFIPIPAQNEDLYFCNIFYKGRMQKEGFKMVNGVETYFYKRRVKYQAQKLIFSKSGYEKQHSLVLFLEKQASGKTKIAVVATFGEDVKAEMVKSLLPMNKNLQVAFLPEKKFAHQHYEAISKAGFPCLIRMPMEPLGRYPYKAGKNSILVSDSKREIKSKFKDYMQLLPDCVGATNYMGSHATAKREIIETLLDCIRKEGMYFIDAKTTSKSVSEIVSAEKDVMYFEKENSLDGKIGSSGARFNIITALNSNSSKSIIYYYHCKTKQDLINLNKFIITASKNGYPLYRLSDLKSMQSPKL